MKYKIGDRVKIVNYRTSLMRRSGEMDKWLGKIMTICATTWSGDYKMQEDNGEYMGSGLKWDESMIECKVGYSKEYR